MMIELAVFSLARLCICARLRPSRLFYAARAVITVEYHSISRESAQLPWSGTVCTSRLLRSETKALCRLNSLRPDPCTRTGAQQQNNEERPRWLQTLQHGPLHVQCGKDEDPPYGMGLQKLLRWSAPCTRTATALRKQSSTLPPHLKLLADKAGRQGANT